jgi:DNA-binding transcriptional regulator LsrR (DeoR family)
LGSKNIRATLEMAKKAKIALVGVASPLNPLCTLNDSGYITEEELSKLEQAGAVCSIGPCVFLNKEAQPCAIDLHQRVMGLSLDDLKAIPTVIAVAGGTEKHAAVRAALQSGLVHILITDEETAGYLLM